MIPVVSQIPPPQKKSAESAVMWINGMALPLVFAAFLTYAGLDFSWGPLHIPKYLQIPLPFYVTFGWAIAPLVGLSVFLIVRRMLRRFMHRRWVRPILVAISTAIFLLVWEGTFWQLSQSAQSRLDSVRVIKFFTTDDINRLNQQLPFRFVEEGDSDGLKVYFEREGNHKSQLQSALWQMGIKSEGMPATQAQ
jgi:hypothetical protein